ncbi:hypothetical protein KSS87_003901, partial [Heliosperma pusillum]
APPYFPVSTPTPSVHTHVSLLLDHQLSSITNSPPSFSNSRFSSGVRKALLIGHDRQLPDMVESKPNFIHLGLLSGSS